MCELVIWECIIKNFKFTQDMQNLYAEQGYYLLRNILPKEFVQKLAKIIDEIMLGTRSIKGRYFQLDDPNQKTNNLNKPLPQYYGPTFMYRKVKNLEFDSDLLNFFQSDIIRKIATPLISEDISIMRAMLLNKPTNGKSTAIPYHQDISEDWPMTSPPQITFWIPLDVVTQKNGCLKVFKGSHAQGKIDNGHIVSKKNVERLKKTNPLNIIKMNPGDILFFNCKLVHGSDVNQGTNRRRAITLCLMDAKIRNTKTNALNPKLFGKSCLTLKTVQKLKVIPSPPLEYQK